ncbi:hypothetical protein [Rhizobium rhizogenes]|uniref:hypothetical protein n=1 Tax=Rhizobium rhizogenes TaxID=359 RepID=UPI0024BE87D8|nr:hypothetical protein [Rhizobium rhizogenes]MDJ1632679.1 hypothetical protein [Rhizobium rhizogenes]
MARLRFTADFDYKPLPSVTIAFRAGQTCVVKRECYDRAIAAGKAVDFYRDKEAGNDANKISR